MLGNEGDRTEVVCAHCCLLNRFHVADGPCPRIALRAQTSAARVLDRRKRLDVARRELDREKVGDLHARAIRVFSSFVIDEHTARPCTHARTHAIARTHTMMMSCICSCRNKK